MSAMHAPPDFDNPRMRQIQDEMNEFMSQDGGPFSDNATDEMIDRYVELQIQQQTAMQAEMQGMMATMMERLTDAVNENLTPDQIQKVQEAQISVMSELPIVSPSMFEALNLSNAQRWQLDEIKKEMTPEYERHLDKLIDAQMRMTATMQEAMDNLRDVDPEERDEFMRNLHENVRRANPDFQRAMNEVMASGRAFSEAFRIRMFDVLTDAQWNRMVHLIDNPPEYLKKVIEEMRKQMGADDSQPNRTSSRENEWVPGPNSWRPGDALPEAYRIERNTRLRQFPRGE
jgi:Ni/Co efflux regulator RcnB